MGHPRKHRKKYNTPYHPWQASRIEAEKKLFDEYGLKNKKELWKMGSLIKRFRDQAKRLGLDTTEQGVKEREQIISKLTKLNLIQSKAIEDVLNLEIKNILERRLQTFVYRQNLAKTINQARQFVVHGHIGVDGKRVNVPSYLVPTDEETKISFLAISNLSNEDHPERIKKQEKKIKKEAKKEEKIESKEKKDEVVVKEEKNKIEIKEKSNGKAKKSE